MIKNIEELVGIGEKLEKVADQIESPMAYVDFCNAQEALAQTTNRLREKWLKVSRAQQAAIDLLTKLRDRGFEKFPGSTQRFLPYNASTVITKVIGLLDGSLKMEEGEDECTA